MYSRVPRSIYDEKLYTLPQPGVSPAFWTKVWNTEYRMLLASEGHKRLRNGAWSGGGPFYMHREMRNHGEPFPTETWKFGSGGSYTPMGVVAVPNSKLAVPQPSVAGAFHEVDDHGLNGYNRTKPGAPLADGYVAGKETHSDGLPKIPFWEPFGKLNRLGFPVSVPFKQIPGRIWRYLTSLSYLGSQYLNIVFGWLPFLRDLRKLFAAMKGLNTRMARLIRENGKGIHRKAELLNERTSTQTIQVYPYPWANVYGACPNYSSGSTYYAVTTTTKKRVWHSARYVYYIDNPDSLLWKAKAVSALLGTTPTPGALWAAMPWTWLTDWFVDMGELMDALSPTAVDRTVRTYGYTMLHDITVIHGMAYVEQEPLESTFAGRTSVPRVRHQFDSIDMVERKIRGTGLNPFAPGNAVDGFSAGQLAILAALGLSRSSH